MARSCWNCGHFETEHIGATGPCIVWIIGPLVKERQCSCQIFDPITIERCEKWIRATYNRDYATGRVMFFLLEELKRCV